MEIVLSQLCRLCSRSHGYLSKLRTTLRGRAEIRTEAPTHFLQHRTPGSREQGRGFPYTLIFSSFFLSLEEVNILKRQITV